MKIEIKQIVGLWSHSLAIYPLGDSHISYTPALKKNSRILENSLKWYLENFDKKTTLSKTSDGIF